MPIDIGSMIEARRPKRRRARRPSRKPKTLRPIKPRPSDEIQYRRELLGLVAMLEKIVATTLLPVLEKIQPEIERDAPSDEIEAALESMRGQVAEMDAFAEERARRMTGDVNRSHEIRYMRELQRKVGLDLEGVIQSEGLENVLKTTVHANVGLIESIPVEYFQKIESLVYANAITGRKDAGSLFQEILGIGESTEARARLIARDQTAKLNSAVNVERNLALGIKEYIWRATGGKSGDGRTRKKHRAHHNKRYRFDAEEGEDGHPGETGHPGEDYQCRCTAEAIIPAF